MEFLVPGDAFKLLPHSELRNGNVMWFAIVQHSVLLASGMSHVVAPFMSSVVASCHVSWYHSCHMSWYHVMCRGINSCVVASFMSYLTQCHVPGIWMREIFIFLSLFIILLEGNSDVVDVVSDFSRLNCFLLASVFSSYQYNYNHVL